MDGFLSTLSTPALMAETTTLAGHLNAANARFLALGAAREKVRVARALEKLPKLSAAMAEGRVSYFKVREMTRVADQANESYLLNIALCGAASHVEETVRGYRRALDAAELSREAIQQRDQSPWFHTEPDGSMVIRGRVPAEIGALFKRALEAAADSLPIPKDVPAGTFSEADEQHRSRKRRVEALATLAEGFLTTGPRDLSGSDRQQIVVHVDAETLRHRHAGRCELVQVPSLAAETARWLACDASVVRIFENAKAEPLDVGRKTRTIPPAIRRALNARDKGCRFPGCCFKRYVDGPGHHPRAPARGALHRTDDRRHALDGRGARS